jgi:hypothetical protein
MGAHQLSPRSHWTAQVSRHSRSPADRAATRRPRGRSVGDVELFEASSRAGQARRRRRSRLVRSLLSCRPRATDLTQVSRSVACGAARVARNSKRFASLQADWPPPVAIPVSRLLGTPGPSSAFACPRVARLRQPTGSSRRAALKSLSDPRSCPPTSCAGRRWVLVSQRRQPLSPSVTSVAVGSHPPC